MDGKTARDCGRIGWRPRSTPREGRPFMRHLPIARPLSALAAACLMTTPFVFCQTPVPAVTAPVATGAQAVQAASTPEALSAALVGKTFYLRGFYQDDKLEFATDGKPVGAPQRGSFAL